MVGAQPADSGQLVVKVADLASGDADELAAEFAVQPGAVTTDVEESVEGLESIDPVTAVSFVISGAEMAHRLWKWWRSRDEMNSDVKLVQPDGTEIHFKDLSEDQLMALVDKVTGG